MFVIENMRLTRNFDFVSDGFYGGIHKKYHDMIVITPFPKHAYGFETEAEAQCVADMYNRRGYNFVVKNRELRQYEIEMEGDCE